MFLVAVLVLVASPVYALFTNGGFETGDTTGWTVSGDHSVITTFTPQFTLTSPGWTSGIPYYGAYSLLLGSPGVGNEWDDYHQSTATQTGPVTQADLDAGLQLYVKWGAILEEPTNYVHSDSAQPYFSIKIWNGGLIYQEDHRANEPGFTKIGTNASGDNGDIWYGTDISQFDLASHGLGVGDSIKIELFVKDCSEGGHGGLVFLDGFGTQRPPDVIPEPGTLLLLGAGLVGLAGYAKVRISRRKKDV